MKKTSDFVDSDDQEVKENTVGLNKKNNQNLGTLLHVLWLFFSMYLFKFLIYT